MIEWEVTGWRMGDNNWTQTGSGRGLKQNQIRVGRPLARQHRGRVIPPVSACSGGAPIGAGERGRVGRGRDGRGRARTEGRGGREGRLRVPAARPPGQLLRPLGGVKLLLSAPVCSIAPSSMLLSSSTRLSFILLLYSFLSLTSASCTFSPPSPPEPPWPLSELPIFITACCSALILALMSCGREVGH